jgi:hypothetical protein
MKDDENIVKTAVETVMDIDSDPIVAVMFECRQSLKRDFGAAALADGHETFSAGLRQIMQRYARRWKARERYDRQMQSQGMPGAGGNGISEETVMPEALGGGLQSNGTQQVDPERSTMPQDGRSEEDGPVGVAALPGQ